MNTKSKNNLILVLAFLVMSLIGVFLSKNIGEKQAEHFYNSAINGIITKYSSSGTANYFFVKGEKFTAIFAKSIEKPRCSLYDTVEKGDSLYKQAFNYDFKLIKEDRREYLYTINPDRR